MVRARPLRRRISLGIAGASTQVSGSDEPAIEATARALPEAIAPYPVPIVVGGDVVRAHRAALEAWGVIPASADDLETTREAMLAYAGAEVSL